MRKIFLILLVALTIVSCEKVIDLKPKDTESRLVVEGNITNESGPYLVKLSKTLPFNESSNFPAVTNAQVVITDDAGQTDLLIHIGDGVYQTNSLQGVVGRTYSLKINLEGETYTASSTMPEVVPLDTITTSTMSFGPNEIIMLTPVFTDPSTIGNYYNFNLFVNGEKGNSYIIWNDVKGNGEVNEKTIRTIGTEINSGDEVKIEMQSVNTVDYQYYFLLSQISSKGPAAGATPSNPPTNISNGALGLFSAHGTSSKTITIP